MLEPRKLRTSSQSLTFSPRPAGADDFSLGLPKLQGSGALETLAGYAYPRRQPSGNEPPWRYGRSPALVASERAKIAADFLRNWSAWSALMYAEPV